MRRLPEPRREQGAIDLLEEAFHLLRLAPVGTLAWFYLGSVPFVLGLLYFVEEMSRNPHAEVFAGEASLGMALAYLGMKAGHAAFAQRLREDLAGPTASRPGPRDRLRIAIAQMEWQATALYLLPAALALIIPFGWVYAFYQNLSVSGDLKQARRQAARWPVQNHILLALLGLFGVVVFFNLGAALLSLPWLLHGLLGLQTVFVQDLPAMLNTTFLAVLLGVTYLAVAPLAKAVYVLRCFHGDSQTTGEDLRAEASRLRFSPADRGVVWGLVLLLALAASRPVGAMVPAPAPEATAGIRRAVPSQEELDRAIRRVAQRREFTWKLPRPAPSANPQRKSLVVRFSETVSRTVARGFHIVGRNLGRFLDWVMRHLGRKRIAPAESRTRGTWPVSVRGLMALLTAVAAALAGLLFWRSHAKRRRAAAAGAQHVFRPEVGSEATDAARAPAEYWYELARELRTGQEYRPAVRALYLGIVSNLARSDFLSPEPSKSNRDYQTELRRRARERPELPPRFEEISLLFESVWYGRREASDEMVERLMAGFQEVRTLAEQ